MSQTQRATAAKSAAPTSAADKRLPAAGRRRQATRPDYLLITIRQAAQEDCARIARLFMMASDGIAEYIWSRVEAPGLSLLEIGECRYTFKGAGADMFADIIFYHEHIGPGTF